MATRLMSQERRRAPRITERVSVAIAGADTELRTETDNLSVSGAYCTLGRFIAPMTKLQLHFELPSSSRRVRIRCSGIVVRVEPVVASAERGRYNVAIFFTDLSERNRSAISRFVRQRLSAIHKAGSDPSRPENACRGV
jgi:hypothetical protein